MESIVRGARMIALAHGPCRVSARLLGRSECQHSLEVCLKFDEMAQFVVDKGLARKIGGDEALAILAAAEREGLVHMVDNALGRVKHTCNCCGHWCWNVGTLSRRKIPRDQLMAVYYLRRTEQDDCVGCGACVEICPVRAVSLVDGRAVVDLEWCIGCGVCLAACPAQCISLARRPAGQPPATWDELVGQVARERPSQG